MLQWSRQRCAGNRATSWRRAAAEAGAGRPAWKGPYRRQVPVNADHRAPRPGARQRRRRHCHDTSTSSSSSSSAAEVDRQPDRRRIEWQLFLATTDTDQLFPTERTPAIRVSDGFATKRYGKLYTTVCPEKRPPSIFNDSVKTPV